MPTNNQIVLILKEKIDIVKVTVDLPGSVPIIAKSLVDQKFVKEVFESDIKF